MESDGEDNQEHQETVIITGDYDADYDNSIPGTQLTVVHAPQIITTTGQEMGTIANSTKSKYYKQTYRSAWENMPDFKGWLRGVPGEPTRAFCVYCQKTLHAHRLSLLKHTCTMRHQKAAQIHQARQLHKKNKFEILVQKATAESSQIEVNVEDPDEEHEMDEDVLVDDGEELEHENEQEEDDEEEEPFENVQPGIRKTTNQYQQFKSSSHAMAPISTHVLDTTKGTPVHGLQVSLYKLIDGRWTYMNECTTNMEGRCWHFVDRKDFSTGRYKLHYDVDRYFELRKQETMYPFIEIVFDCHALMDSFHVPLLLSPFGYTTYRGT